MKITGIDSVVLRIPPPRPMSLEFKDHRMVAAFISTDQGVEGFGYTLAFGGGGAEAMQVYLETRLKPLLLGEDPRQVERLWEKMFRADRGIRRVGLAAYAVAALDIALWDLAGKAAGLPLHRLLGGGARTEIRAYASFFRYGDASVVARITEGAVKDGYKYIKLHETTEPAVRAARQGGGPEMKLTVDTNCPWTPVEALEMARRFRSHDLLWLEEPVWPPEDWAGLARVRQEGGIALAAGENASNPIDFKHMFDAGAVTYAQPSVTKIGGVSALREVGILAEAAGVTLVPHSPYFGPGLLATLHFLAAQPREPLAERIYATLEPDLFGGATNAKNGLLAVPQGPGLGVDPDPAVIARYKTA
jgi:L-alanine-DL-glutamate epimerase-like enolase superfamily enzyme